MKKIIPFIIILIFTNCTNSKTKKTQITTENQPNTKVEEHFKTSAELSGDAETILMNKREKIDRLIDTLNILYTKAYGKEDAAKRMVLLIESQELFVKYKDAMRDVYCFDSDEIGSGWAQNEFIFKYVITLLDARINQLNFLKEAELETC
jgi:hypothetical protein